MGCWSAFLHQMRNIWSVDSRDSHVSGHQPETGTNAPKDTPIDRGAAQKHSSQDLAQTSKNVDSLPLSEDAETPTPVFTDVVVPPIGTHRECGQCGEFRTSISGPLELLKESVEKGACPTCPILWHFLEQFLPYHPKSYTWVDLIRPANRGLPLEDGEEVYPGQSSNGCMLVDVRPKELGLRTLCSVEFFTVPNTPSPFPCVGSAQILPQNSSRDRLDRAKEWLNHCLRTHERCRRPEEENYPLPKRLVDVSGPKEDGPVRLIETSNHERPYLCLSHCWGDPGRHPLRTLEGGHPIEGDETNLTEGNLDSHMKGIAFHDLPGTFRDAVSVVRALGQRYLWIDSLCIIQDSGKDWDQEAKRMADIYQNSYLTLAATKSMDSTGGLFSRPGAEYNARAFSVKDTNNNSYTLYCRKARPHWFGQSDRSEYQGAPTLLSRAWVYQERVLSPRTLHFGREELLWECREGSTCECSLWPVPNKQCLRFDSDFSPGIMEVGANWQTKTVTNRWRSAVEEYSCLDMTKAKDRLPAIAGVAKQVQLLRGGERYHVGLWEKSLLEDLLWYVPDRWQVNRTTERAPSWTWACVDKGPITFYSLDEFMHEQPDPIERLAEVVEVKLGDGDAFLGVQAGSIKLNGLLFAATLTCNEEGEFVVLLDTDLDDDPEWWFKNRKFFPDFDFWSSDIPESSGGAVLEENMYCFLTHMTYPYDAGPKFSFLALRPKGEEKEGEPTFERVGLVTTLTPVIDWNLDGGKHGADRDPQTITIV